MTDSALTTSLRPLEEQLLDPAFRRDRAAVSALLADTFVEYGSSGRIFTKTQILDHLAAGSPQRIEMADFAVQLIAPDVALVTWRAISHAAPGQPAISLRSSLWIRRDHRWQILFHQGTPAA
jgi:hypothetical protein